MPPAKRAFVSFVQHQCHPRPLTHLDSGGWLSSHEIPGRDIQSRGLGSLSIIRFNFIQSLRQAEEDWGD
jgi:hypothetical protein